MRKAFICLILQGCALYSFAQQQFYYAFSEKIPLQQDGQKVAVTLKQAESSFRFDATQTGKRIMDKLFVFDNFPAEAKRSTIPNLRNIHPVLKAADGIQLLLNDEILVSFKEGISEYQLNSIKNKFGLTLISNSTSFSLYQIPENANCLEIANRVYETGLVKFSQPNFVSKVEKFDIPNDPFFANQFSLHNTGQVLGNGHSGAADADVDAPEAWDITKGSNSIIVAVIDEGVTSDHPDLPNSRQVRLNGSNFAASYDGTNPNDPSPVGNDNHGNACAGIIAATQSNNEGVTGIAPLCKIMPIRISFESQLPASVFAAAIDFAVNNGAHVISNSWGNSSLNPNFHPVIVTAIQNAVTNGRWGKGCVVLFASSNTADHFRSENGIISFPGNANVNTLITVGASDRYDNQANYSPTSNPGSSYNQIIDIVAPSHRAYPWQIDGEDLEVATIDIPGPDGGKSGWLPYFEPNYQSYTMWMGGTSAATPLVAGIAALMLSVDPNLTAQEVFNIITCSADDVGPYTYTNGFSNEMGNGRVNAFRSVMGVCPLSYTINWPIASGSILTYRAKDYITASNTISSNTDVDILAQNVIKLESGFSADPGSNVTLMIQPCPNCGTSGAPLREFASENSSESLVSIDALFSESISLQPNPAMDRLRVNAKIQGKAISFAIVNQFGNEFMHGDISSNDFEVNVSNLENGVYILEIETAESIYHEKFMVIK